MFIKTYQIMWTVKIFYTHLLVLMIEKKSFNVLKVVIICVFVNYLFITHLHINFVGIKMFV